MAISDKKRRYSVTLTPSVVDRFQVLAKAVGIPTTVSTLCEDALKQTSILLQTIKEQGSLNAADLRRIMGQQQEQELFQIEKEEINVSEKRTKKKTT